MDKKEYIAYWINNADEDLITAESLFNSGRYTWCLFIGHLVLEKIIKAHFIKDNIDNFPPKTHDLIRLTTYIKIEFSYEQMNFLDEVNDYNLEARYPEIKSNFVQICTKEYTELNFIKIKELYSWLKSGLK